MSAPESGALHRREPGGGVPARYRTLCRRAGQGLVSLGLLAAAILGACASTPEPDRPTLRVLTLNLRHARGPGSGRLVQDVPAFRRRVDAVAAMLRRERVDVAAFQEVDAESVWSGGFHHLESVAEAIGWGEPAFGPYSRMKTAGGSGVESGSAVIARYPLVNVDWGRFTGPPLDHKGYVVATVRWEGREIDVVSVHLHSVLTAIRLDQVRALVGELADRGRPLIVTGDFNCGLDDEEKTLRVLAEKLRLEAWRPKAKDLATHPVGRATRRIDWIFATAELEIVALRNLPDRISDHHAVLAEIAWRL
jgi:endonuclease/exonuclease/phosphatase family metal-dependent hydrolase